jgi:DNA-binding XRE family transcriptional regulator
MEKGLLPPIYPSWSQNLSLNETKMKDRIKKIMESMHMTQQVFADTIGIAPATLSGIFNERTKPSINIIEAIKKKFPNLNTDWLMFGLEPMYINVEGQKPVDMPPGPREELLDFDQPYTPTPQTATRQGSINIGVRNTQADFDSSAMKNIDKTPRRVTEIRIFYDDQTWESFVPSKK